MPWYRIVDKSWHIINQNVGLWKIITSENRWYGLASDVTFRHTFSRNYRWNCIVIGIYGIDAIAGIQSSLIVLKR